MKVNGATHEIRRHTLAQAIEVAARVKQQGTKDAADLIVADARKFEAYLTGDDQA